MALDPAATAGLASRVLAAVPESGARAAEPAHMPTIDVVAAHMPAVLAFLRDEPDLACGLFVDATVVDREAADGCLEVVYVVRSTADFSTSIVVRTTVDAADPRMPTSSGVLAGANWAEREIYDMFGVHFEGHPDPRRILMYPEFVGHPLRKSYPYQKRQPLTPERDPVTNPWPKRH